MIRPHSIFDSLDSAFLAASGIKEESFLENAIVYEKAGQIIGIAKADERCGFVFLDTLYIAQKHYKAGIELLRAVLEPYKEHEYFYFEVQKENPHHDDLWYQKSELVVDDEKKTIYKRRVSDVCICGIQN